MGGGLGGGLGAPAHATAAGSLKRGLKVMGLPPGVQDRHMVDHFTRHGAAPAAVRVKSDQGFATVAFSTPEDASAALKQAALFSDPLLTGGAPVALKLQFWEPKGGFGGGGADAAPAGGDGSGGPLRPSDPRGVFGGYGAATAQQQQQQQQQPPRVLLSRPPSVPAASARAFSSAVQAMRGAGGAQPAMGFAGDDAGMDDGSAGATQRFGAFGGNDGMANGASGAAGVQASLLRTPRTAFPAAPAAAGAAGAAARRIFTSPTLLGRPPSLRGAPAAAMDDDSSGSGSGAVGMGGAAAGGAQRKPALAVARRPAAAPAAADASAQAGLVWKRPGSTQAALAPEQVGLLGPGGMEADADAGATRLREPPRILKKPAVLPAPPGATRQAAPFGGPGNGKAMGLLPLPAAAAAASKPPLQLSKQPRAGGLLQATSARMAPVPEYGGGGGGGEEEEGEEEFHPAPSPSPSPPAAGTRPLVIQKAHRPVPAASARPLSPLEAEVQEELDDEVDGSQEDAEGMEEGREEEGEDEGEEGEGYSSSEEYSEDDEAGEEDNDNASVTSTASSFLVEESPRDLADVIGPDSLAARMASAASPDAVPAKSASSILSGSPMSRRAMAPRPPTVRSSSVPPLPVAAMVDEEAEAALQAADIPALFDTSVEDTEAEAKALGYDLAAADAYLQQVQDVARSSAADPADGLVAGCEDMCPQDEIDGRLDRNEIRTLERPVLVPAFLNDGVAGVENTERRVCCVKEYGRSTAMAEERQSPALQRSPRALRRTLDYLFSEILDADREGKAFYTDNDWSKTGVPVILEVQSFVWDRMRQIGKDFNVQNYTHLNRLDAVALESYERMVRCNILLAYELCHDREFTANKDRLAHAETVAHLKTVLELYDYAQKRSVPGVAELQSPHEAEFRAYYIICFMLDEKEADSIATMLLRLASESPALLRHPQLAHALALMNAAQLNDWRLFWRLVEDRRNMTFLMGALLHRHLNELRARWLRMLFAIGKADLPLDILQERLRFETGVTTAAFCEAHGLVVERKGDARVLKAGKGTFIKPTPAFDRVQEHHIVPPLHRKYYRRDIVNQGLWALSTHTKATMACFAPVNSSSGILSPSRGVLATDLRPNTPGRLLPLDIRKLVLAQKAGAVARVTPIKTRSTAAVPLTPVSRTASVPAKEAARAVPAKPLPRPPSVAQLERTAVSTPFSPPSPDVAVSRVPSPESPVVEAVTAVSPVVLPEPAPSAAPPATAPAWGIGFGTFVPPPPVVSELTTAAPAVVDKPAFSFGFAAPAPAAVPSVTAGGFSGFTFGAVAPKPAPTEAEESARRQAEEAEEEERLRRAVQEQRRIADEAKRAAEARRREEEAKQAERLREDAIRQEEQRRLQRQRQQQQQQEAEAARARETLRLQQEAQAAAAARARQKEEARIGKLQKARVYFRFMQWFQRSEAIRRRRATSSLLLSSSAVSFARVPGSIESAAGTGLAGARRRFPSASPFGDVARKAPRPSAASVFSPGAASTAGLGSSRVPMAAELGLASSRISVGAVGALASPGATAFSPALMRVVSPEWARAYRKSWRPFDLPRLIGPGIAKTYAGNVKLASIIATLGMGASGGGADATLALPRAFFKLLVVTERRFEGKGGLSADVSFTDEWLSGKLSRSKQGPKDRLLSFGAGRSLALYTVPGMQFQKRSRVGSSSEETIETPDFGVSVVKVNEDQLSTSSAAAIKQTVSGSTGVLFVLHVGVSASESGASGTIGLDCDWNKARARLGSILIPLAPDSPVALAVCIVVVSMDEDAAPPTDFERSVERRVHAELRLSVLPADIIRESHTFVLNVAAVSLAHSIDTGAALTDATAAQSSHQPTTLGWVASADGGLTLTDLASPQGPKAHRASTNPLRASRSELALSRVALNSPGIMSRPILPQGPAHLSASAAARAISWTAMHAPPQPLMLPIPVRELLRTTLHGCLSSLRAPFAKTSPDPAVTALAVVQGMTATLDRLRSYIKNSALVPVPSELNDAMGVGGDAADIFGTDAADFADSNRSHNRWSKTVTGILERFEGAVASYSSDTLTTPVADAITDLRTVVATEYARMQKLLDLVGSLVSSKPAQMDNADNDEYVIISSQESKPSELAVLDAPTVSLSQDIDAYLFDQSQSLSTTTCNDKCLTLRCAAPIAAVAHTVERMLKSWARSLAHGCILECSPEKKAKTGIGGGFAGFLPVRPLPWSSILALIFNEVLEALTLHTSTLHMPRAGGPLQPANECESDDERAHAAVWVAPAHLYASLVHGCTRSESFIAASHKISASDEAVTLIDGYETVLGINAAASVRALSSSLAFGTTLGMAFPRAVDYERAVYALSALKEVTDEAFEDVFDQLQTEKAAEEAFLLSLEAQLASGSEGGIAHTSGDSVKESRIPLAPSAEANRSAPVASPFSSASVLTKQDFVPLSLGPMSVPVGSIAAFVSMPRKDNAVLAVRVAPSASGPPESSEDAEFWALLSEANSVLLQVKEANARVESTFDTVMQQDRADAAVIDSQQQQRAGGLFTFLDGTRQG
jgi:hypothetical protein